MNTLHRHAHPPCRIEATFHQLGSCQLEVCIHCNEGRHDAPVFKRTGSTRGKLRSRHPSHTGAADDAPEGDVLIAHQPGGDVVFNVRRTWHHAGGSPGSCSFRTAPEPRSTARFDRQECPGKRCRLLSFPLGRVTMSACAHASSISFALACNSSTSTRMFSL